MCKRLKMGQVQSDNNKESILQANDLINNRSVSKFSLKHSTDKQCYDLSHK